MFLGLYFTSFPLVFSLFYFILFFFFYYFKLKFATQELDALRSSMECKIQTLKADLEESALKMAALEQSKESLG